MQSTNANNFMNIIDRKYYFLFIYFIILLFII